MSKLSIPVIRGVTVFVGGVIVGTIFTFFGTERLIDRSKLPSGSPIEQCAALKGCPPHPGGGDDIEDYQPTPDDLDDLMAWARCVKECADDFYADACGAAEAMGRGDLCP